MRKIGNQSSGPTSDAARQSSCCTKFFLLASYSTSLALHCYCATVQSVAGVPVNFLKSVTTFARNFVVCINSIIDSPPAATVDLHIHDMQRAICQLQQRSLCRPSYKQCVRMPAIGAISADVVGGVSQDVESVQLFKAQWNVYQKMLDHDYLHHSALYGTLKQYLEQRMQVQLHSPLLCRPNGPLKHIWVPAWLPLT